MYKWVGGVLYDVSIYDQIMVSTYSEVQDSICIQSNPWTVCYEYDSVYLGQYVGIRAFVGQRIYLSSQQRDGVTESYAAEFARWDYH